MTESLADQLGELLRLVAGSDIEGSGLGLLRLRPERSSRHQYRDAARESDTCLNIRHASPRTHGVPQLSDGRDTNTATSGEPLALNGHREGEQGRSNGAFALYAVATAFNGC